MLQQFAVMFVMFILAVGFATAGRGPANGIYVLVAKHSGSVLTDNNNDVEQYAYDGGADQQWEITNLGANKYMIINVQSGRAMDVSGAGGSGSDVITYPYSGSDNQKWTFSSNGNYYSIHPVHDSGSCLDVLNASISNGADVITYTSSGSNNQLFSLEDTSYTPPPLPAETIALECNGCTPFQPGYIYGTWLLFHGGDNVLLTNQGEGPSIYTIRYETEYWVRSGSINQPGIDVISGTNTLIDQYGTSDKGSCRGKGFPWEQVYELDGQVRWTNYEWGGCAYNLALRDGN